MHTIQVKGMSCQHCQAAVKEALEELGLTEVEVELKSGQVTYCGQVEKQALQDAIEDAGFELE
ncbi:MAG: heavy-metal-associated domain-containing protein [Oscillospiraceae bacterium]